MRFGPTFRWLSWSVPSVALATFSGIPFFIFLSGMLPDVSGHLSQLALVSLMMTPIGAICILGWICIASVFGAAEKTWPRLLLFFPVMVVFLGQVSSRYRDPASHDSLISIAVSFYFSIAMLVPRVVDKRLKPGCFAMHTPHNSSSKIL